MALQIGYFAGKATCHLILENGHQEERWLEREVWSDRDIDGRWLVGATSARPMGDEITGDIVVKAPAISAFIELLATLVAEPERFAEQDVVLGPTWDGRFPVA